MSWVMEVHLDEVGAYFLGNLFVRLVHRFALHKSANTLFLAQMSPYVMDMCKDKTSTDCQKTVHSTSAVMLVVKEGSCVTRE
jgi:hypothetical protein